MMGLNYKMVHAQCQKQTRSFQIYHKKHETLTTNPLIHCYTNRINNSFMFKIKDGYKLELKMHETMKSFGNTKN